MRNRPTLPLSRSSRGFSLVELALVLVILGVALVVVGANLGNLIPYERLRKAATDLGNMLQYARSESAATGVNYAVVYDLDENEYWMLVPRLVDERYRNRRPGRANDDDTRWQMFRTELPHDIEFTDIQFGEGAKRTRGEVHVEVTPMGTASGHIVHLINTRTDEEYSVELNALTALVTYHIGYVEFEEVIDYD